MVQKPKIFTLNGNFTVWQPETLMAMDRLAAIITETHEIFNFCVTPDEHSFVLDTKYLPEDADGAIESGWKGFKIEGPLDFGLTGILNACIDPLARNSISIFATSTYDTDYFLVKEDDFEGAQRVLSEEGYVIEPSA